MKTGMLLSATGLSLTLAACAPAQTPAGAQQSAQAPAPAPPPSAAPAPAAAGAKTFSRQEIEQLVAPIALHPDALFSQILMASTYPLEIVEADRWVKSHPGLKDKALEDALQGQSWDPA